MHERVSFNNLCFMDAPLEDDIVTWKTLGAKTIGLFTLKFDVTGWGKGVAMVRDLGLNVATLMHPFLRGASLDQQDHWDTARSDLMRTIEAAQTLGAQTIYMTTGGRGSLDWEDAAAAFKEAVAPCAAAAAARGVPLLIEMANTGYADIHLTHTLRDTVTLAKASGLGVCIDVFACWTEPGLREAIYEAAPLTRLVQVSDYAPGDLYRFSRAVPGDGMIPLSKILTTILDAGFSGAFDLELIGRRIQQEGSVAATKRGADWVDRFLVDYETKH